MAVTFEKIQSAYAQMRSHLRPTPSRFSPLLSQQTHTHLILKFENLQRTGSFKDRGAWVKMESLCAQEKVQGVLAVSAGNHAQAVADQANQRQIPATLIMPSFAPQVKVDRTRQSGAEILLQGETLDDAIALGLALARDRGLTFIHPYDDEQIITGQGTVALELLQAHPDLEVLIVPVGGGGLLAGMAIAAKHLKPNLHLIGVETEQFPTLWQTLHQHPIRCGHSTLADGIAVKSPGHLTQPILEQWMDELVLVDETAIEAALLLLLDTEKTLVEGAGAVALAALFKLGKRLQGKDVGIILSGGNIDPLTLSAVIQRNLFRTARLVHLYVTLRDIPGSLAQVTQILAAQGANIMEVHHHREFSALALQTVELELVLLTRGHTHLASIQADLEAAHCQTRTQPIACQGLPPAPQILTAS
ncbi:threonine ammonia-lyase [Lyngbya confervoides]|uniref:L-threonine dehydratase catabolic TdcB n=1 Tax=Lyngbya confervoides BDU141951 TaxID=1574623 RepID=A0ABD4T053_9CYAN|nr:threonine ammonia-lyase [Lyngbya confervoides]MCM1981821.1 threonine ammonia-lyase [Lyngbya confervoides BDU141951]